MPSWFDIRSTDLSDKESICKETFLESAKRVKSHITREIKNVGGDSKKLIIGGFS